MCSAKQNRMKLIRVSFHVLALVGHIYRYLGRLYCYIHRETILEELVVHRPENSISAVVGHKESVSQGSFKSLRCRHCLMAEIAITLVRPGDLNWHILCLRARI